MNSKRRRNEGRVETKRQQVVRRVTPIDMRCSFARRFVVDLRSSRDNERRRRRRGRRRGHEQADGVRRSATRDLCGREPKRTAGISRLAYRCVSRANTQIERETTETEKEKLFELIVFVVGRVGSPVKCDTRAFVVSRFQMDCVESIQPVIGPTTDRSIRLSRPSLRVTRAKNDARHVFIFTSDFIEKNKRVKSQ
jgi:hypothetical protein